ncbi:protein ALP1-like [Phragmites australis]|uniref:protein ALP1-like n=1 Tax=Phragmites australis TaxID=29695 RepID=UPI002D7822A7|nr:protein ALP1-like [Phragmites australis]
MYYADTYLNKSRRRESILSGHDWVMHTLNIPKDCYDMFRMSRPLFDTLHNLLVSSYGLKSSSNMSSIEALGMFLWTIGAPQSFTQVKNRFERSKETISRKFNEVLDSIYLMSIDVVKPRDPEFTMVHPRLQGSRFAPYFNNCIGAIDGTHIPVVVPAAKLVQHVGRHGYSTQNVLAICDFDMRFTFVVAGWPGSVHDMRVFNDAIQKYADKFPFPSHGKFYLVDSGYPNRTGFLAHVLVARRSVMSDEDFDMCDQDENYMPIPSQGSGENSELGEEEGDMNIFRDNLANALYAMRE